jgi:hypothetical protein
MGPKALQKGLTSVTAGYAVLISREEDVIGSDKLRLIGATRSTALSGIKIG